MTPRPIARRSIVRSWEFDSKLSTNSSSVDIRSGEAGVMLTGESDLDDEVVTYQVCDTADGTFRDFVDADGNSYNIDTAAEDTCYVLPSELAPFPFVQVRVANGIGPATPDNENHRISVKG